MAKLHICPRETVCLFTLLSTGDPLTEVTIRSILEVLIELADKTTQTPDTLSFKRATKVAPGQLKSAFANFDVLRVSVSLYRGFWVALLWLKPPRRKDLSFKQGFDFNSQVKN